MKIIHYLSYPGYGGAERYAANIGIEGIKDGADVLFVLDTEGPLTEILKREKIKYELLNSDVRFMPLRYLLGLPRFRKMVKAFSPDVIHTHFLRENVIACIVKLFGKRTKVIRTIHRLDRFENLPQKLTCKFLNALTDKFVAPSAYAARQMVDRGYISEKITVINNGTEVISSEIPESRAVGMLTRLEKGKGAVEFIQSLPEDFDDFDVMIAGDGELRAELERLITVKNLTTIQLVGRVDNLPNFFSEVTLLLHPSLNESTLPMSVIETLSTGKEAVIFDIPATKEFSGPGLIKVEKENWEALREKVAQQLKKPDFRKDEIKEYFSDNFSRESLWSKVRTLYRT